MSSAQLYDSLLTELAPLDRAQILARLTRYTGNIPLDFTPDFLATCDTDKLRHLLLAAEWRSRWKTLAH